MAYGIRRAIIFGIDGAGTFFEQTETPSISALEARGAVCSHALAEYPTVSAECWGGILLGTSAERHRLTNAMVEYAPYPGDSMYPSVFRVIRQAMPGAEMASFVQWTGINHGIIEDDVGVYKHSDKDAQLVEPVRQYILETDFTLLFLQFDGVDGTGHQFGYGSQEHLQAITTVDGYIGRIMEAVEQRGWLEDTLVIVTADHGGTPLSPAGGASHGGMTDAEKYVRISVSGGELLRGEIEGMRIRDISPIVLKALGLPQPESWNGGIPNNVFPDAPAGLPRPQGIMPGGCNYVMAQNYPGESSPDKALNMQPAFCIEGSIPQNAERHGKLYEITLLGKKAIRLDDGWFSVPIQPQVFEGEQGFSVTCMLHLPDIESWGVFASTGAWASKAEGEPGGLACFSRYRYITLGYCDPETNRFRHSQYNMPADVGSDWMFLVAVFDKEKGELRYSMNLQPFITCRMNNAQQLCIGGDRLYMGQDKYSNFPTSMAGSVARFCIYDKPITEKDLETMRSSAQQQR